MSWLTRVTHRFGKTAHHTGATHHRLSEHRTTRPFRWRLQRLEQLEERTLLSIEGPAAPTEMLARPILTDASASSAVEESGGALSGSSAAEADSGVVFAWTAPEALNTNAATDSGDDGWPQVATDSLGNWVAVWESEDSLNGTIGDDYDILVSRSDDDGLNWTAPVPLNTNAGADSGQDLRPQVTTDGAGNWISVVGFR